MSMLVYFNEHVCEVGQGDVYWNTWSNSSGSSTEKPYLAINHGEKAREGRRKTETGREINRERERHGGGGSCRFAASFLINLDNILSYESFHFPNIAQLSSCTIKRSRQRLLTTF